MTGKKGGGRETRGIEEGERKFAAVPAYLSCFRANTPSPPKKSRKRETEEKEKPEKDLGLVCFVVYPISGEKTARKGRQKSSNFGLCLVLSFVHHSSRITFLNTELGEKSDLF